ncbi:MAG: nickel-dependent lactate racemase, partial [Deltaproteobacteria bacterium]|nr:nickel-dependent lactate racemase [Deltaproteobacteria bacterium]
GVIEPHCFAGFSGGREAVFPGVCSVDSISEIHCYRAIASPYATAGVLENNPVHIDMVHAARKAGVAFICNVTLNADGKITAAFAGELEEAHLKGCEFVRSLAQCTAVKGDIVVTSNGGYPLDQTLYQTAGGFATALGCANEDAVIIMAAGCADGIGGEAFEEIILSGTPESIDRKLAALSPTETIPGQWNAQIHVRALKKHRIIFVTSHLEHDLVRKANMVPALSLDEAMATAFAMKGEEARVVVIPDGASVIPAGC